MTVPDEAVEAAARAMSPRAWGPQVWTLAAHGESPTAARARVQQESLADARRALEAAAPFIAAQAWDEAVASLEYRDGSKVEVAASHNPYRSAK